MEKRCFSMLLKTEKTSDDSSQENSDEENSDEEN